MKKIFFLSMLLVTAAAFGQSAKTVFESDKMIWFGLDFTKAKMIGMSGESPSQIKEIYFRSWNTIILDEPQKFDLGKFFRKSKVNMEIEQSERRNRKVDVDELFGYNEKEITKEMVNELVKGFDTGERQEGLGLLFIIESFNKPAKEAVFHVTFFDIASKKVLLTKEVRGIAKGFGLRNFWANAIHNGLDKIDRRLYKEWKDDAK